MDFRRMLPSDLQTCIQLSDSYGAISHMRYEEPLHALLYDLILNNQLWGSVVMKEGRKEPVCFGACLFISDPLALALLAGEHPFLLLKMCDDSNLRREILSFDAVIEASQAEGLNFYGGPFRLPQVLWEFPEGADKLQASLERSMAGFKIKHHFKHVYGQVEATKMRFGFGARVLADYGSSRDYYVKKHRPILVGEDRVRGAKKHPKPVSALMRGGEGAKLTLTEIQRHLLLLKLERLSNDWIEEHLDMGTRSIETYWSQIVEEARRHPEVAELANLDGPETSMRDAFMNYLESNLAELGVLPQLTPLERELAGGAARRKRRAVPYPGTQLAGRAGPTDRASGLIRRTQRESG